jgi:hypothetical protein
MHCALHVSRLGCGRCVCAAVGSRTGGRCWSPLGLCRARHRATGHGQPCVVARSGSGSAMVPGPGVGKAAEYRAECDWSNTAWVLFNTNYDQ